MVDSATPDDVITLLCQDNTAAGKFDTEPTADQYQESFSILALHPPRSLVAARMDAPFDLHHLAVARIVSVLEVPKEPTPVQRRVLARVSYVHAIVHTSER
jgi:hypothetical protein